jgi:hypothetical protein
MSQSIVLIFFFLVTIELWILPFEKLVIKWTKLCSANCTPTYLIYLFYLVCDSVVSHILYLVFYSENHVTNLGEYYLQVMSKVIHFYRWFVHFLFDLYMR